MKTLEVTTISSKGQVVIPANVRKEMHLSNGSKLMVLTEGDNLLLKPIYKPNVEAFEELMRRSQQYAKEVGLKKSDVKKAIKKVRRENRP